MVDGRLTVRRFRAYVDTSVFGGLHDEEFAEVTARFFKRVARGEFIILVSRLTSVELEDAPAHVSRTLDELSPDQLEPVELGREVSDLASDYVRAGVLGVGSMDDAIHVAAATVAGADLILSWNFRHIVSFDRIRGFNSVNVRNGYRPMTILSPREVADVEADESI